MALGTEEGLASVVQGPVGGLQGAGVNVSRGRGLRTGKKQVAPDPGKPQSSALSQLWILGVRAVSPGRPRRMFGYRSIGDAEVLSQRGRFSSAQRSFSWHLLCAGKGFQRRPWRGGVPVFRSSALPRAPGLCQASFHSRHLFPAGSERHQPPSRGAHVYCGEQAA